jgi:hypothetical protein
MILRFIRRKHLRTIAIVLIADFGFFNFTNANKATTAQLFLGIALVLLTGYFVVYGLLHAVNMYGFKIKGVKRTSIYTSSLIALLIALQSMGQLSIRDVIILIPLSYIVYIYLGYIGNRNQQIH